MDINNIKWQPATKKPEDWDEPILCCTSKGKLCVFKETKVNIHQKIKNLNIFHYLIVLRMIIMWYIGFIKKMFYQKNLKINEYEWAYVKLEKSTG